MNEEMQLAEKADSSVFNDNLHAAMCREYPKYRISLAERSTCRYDNTSSIYILYIYIYIYK